MSVKTKDIPTAPSGSKARIAAVVLCGSIVFILSLLFIYCRWDAGIKATAKEAIDLAEIAEAGLFRQTVFRVVEQPDTDSPDYQDLKNSLSHIAALDNKIRFAYLFVQREGNIYIIADSEPEGSADYSPPGQLYSEADPVFFRPFTEGSTILTKPVRDRWGEWICVLVPIKEAGGNKIIAALGVDYMAGVWDDRAVSNAFQASLMVLCIWIILLGIFLSIRRNRQLREEKQKLGKSDEKLHQSEYLFRTLFDQASIGVAIVRNYRFLILADSGHPGMNPMFEKIMGRSREELASTDWPDITHPDDLAADMEQFQKFKSGVIDGYDMEKRFIRPDGSAVWIHMMISPLRLDSVPENSHLCLIEDISRRKELEKILQDSERSKAILLDNLPGMTYRCNFDREWTMQYVSNGCLALTGYRPESLLFNRDLSYNDLIAPDYRKRLWDYWEKAAREHHKMEGEYEIVTASGDTKWVWEQGQGIYDDGGKVVALEGLILDITDRKNNEIRLRYLSEHDTLTGLYNRRCFNETVAEKAKAASRCAAVMVNVYRFSVINSTFGYRFGESLIKEFAECLALLASENALLFHVAIDRFAFLVTGYRGKKELADFCETLIRCLDDGMTQKTFNVNIGVAEIDVGAADADMILKNTSVAAGHVNHNERFGYCFFDKDMENALKREIDIRQALSDAAGSSVDPFLYLQYQPILDMKTEKIAGFEALARYRNDRLGTVSPLEFIPIAESNQLMISLGIKIMRLAFGFAVRLTSAGYPGIAVSINISAIQLLSESFLTDLETLLKETGADPKSINLEITESIFASNYQEINQKLDVIRQFGIQIAIDDFGTGYSSLARERELNVNCLKIDKYFIDKLAVLGSNQAITGDIISMAHKLGHCVVAEGVEQEKQKKYLARHHCDMMQGYYFSRPLEETAALEFLEKINRL